MLGTKKLSEIKEELREAAAAEGYNPIADLDREIQKLEKAKAGRAKGLKSLQALRHALAQIVADNTTPATKRRRVKKTV